MLVLIKAGQIIIDVRPVQVKTHPVSSLLQMVLRNEARLARHQR